MLIGDISLRDQEIFGWVGTAIFFFAQVAQIVHTYKIKQAGDVSYILEILWVIGNIMYTIFGILDDSYSMAIGNGATLITSIIQLGQKVYYEKYYNQNRGYNQIN